MVTRFIDRNIITALLAGACTPREVRELVQRCYDLALPVIRKKISLGKLNLGAMGLTEADVVYDCLADLFQRDDRGGFSQVRNFFEQHVSNVENCSHHELLIALRILVVGSVNNNIVRLYGEADPALRKILRNLKIALDRSRHFDRITRFNETYLVPAGIEALLHRPPVPLDFLKQEFSRVVLLDDSVPEMLTKLHSTICGQEEYQRAVPLVVCAILFKEVYALGWQAQQEAETVPQDVETAESDVQRIVDDVCRGLQTDMSPGYVQSGKCSQKIFENYIQALRDILLNEFGANGTEGISYFDCLQLRLPGLTKAGYMQHHRTIMEYLAKIAKERVREELKR
ncbi:MAG: hypothetical protein ABSF91_02610 [Bacteroidota bacterium]|jgi:hypothetical protein